jgi:tRNA A-37 threonylcarbamoyl transferase component Bud32
VTRQSRLDELAALIDDGQPIDWDREMQEAVDAEARRLVEGLKTLADVADLLKNPERLEKARPAQAGTPWADLTVFEAVGRGAFGTVHRALDPLNRIVALKLLDPGVDLAHLKGRILEEGRLLARVRHPNIVGVFGAGESDGRVGLWMEFVDGWTLAAEVETHGPMSAEEATIIGRKLCGTLVAIHAEGYVHADVKAHNVMRERGGRIVLMDFGAGQALVDADARRLAGTPLYLSPERLLGAAASPSCDIYALGVLLYFLVTGAYPVDGDTREDIEAAHRDGRYVRLRDRRPDLPDAFVAAVEDALATAPAARHATAGAFDAALARVIASHPASASPAAAATVSLDDAKGHAASTPAATRHRRWMVPALAAAVVAASVVGIVRYTADEPSAALRPPTAPPAAAAAPAGEYEVHAAFYQVGPSGRQLKASGERIGRGDVLELDLRLSHDARVYVVNEDDQGSASLLFPLADGLLRNPLRGGQTYTLPGPDSTRPVQWEIDAHGGREHFYVIVSPEDDPIIRAAIHRLTPASDNPELNARAEPPVGGLRGASKLSHVQTAPLDRDAPWRKLAKPLAAGDERGRGLWIRELTLEKPLPTP